MLNLNDDMDDLIRQAADDYPLKTEDGKDWDKVLAGLQSAAPTTPVNNKKYRWLLLLLLPLLLALPVLYKNAIQKPPVSLNKKTIGTTKQEAANAPTAQTNKAFKQADRSNKETINTDTIKAAPTENKKEAPTKNYSNTNKKTATNKSTVVVLNEIHNKKKSIAENNNSVDSITTAPVTNAAISNNNKSNSTALENNNKVSSTDSISKPITATKETAKRSAEDEKATTAIIGSTHLNTAIAPQNDSAATAKKMNIKHTTPVKRKGVYAGVAAALDATTVKLHKIDNIGYTTSVVLGYRINNQWSVESGVMWDKKDYYSPGKYLDKVKTGFSADYNIHYLNGYCKMFEVPVMVKYDFRSKKRSGFFVAAGLSSYIMHRESYNYFVSHYSAPNAPGYFRQKDYVNTTTNLFSVANISGGYQFIFKNSNSLRIEPYLKVPLSGLGIGKLPFTSIGISAAYMLPIH